MMTPSSQPHHGSSEQTQHYLEAYLARLEEERLKIDSFKRDLPICMQLLTNAMERSRQELQSHRTNQSSISPIQFIPLKNATEINDAERANWMASAQIWNHDIEENDAVQLLDLNAKQGMSFDEDEEANSMLDTIPRRSSDNNSGESCGNNKNNNHCLVAESKEHKNTTRRKARRCWSPDLHKRFVNALHMLGGSQATPKQIRELMKVDGLTNDEVKSHLQKYRLHTRIGTSEQGVATTTMPGGHRLVILGWVPPEYAAAHDSSSRAPMATLCGTTCSQYHS